MDLDGVGTLPRKRLTFRTRRERRPSTFFPFPIGIYAGMRVEFRRS
jgi:hypothetical protein